MLFLCALSIPNFTEKNSSTGDSKRHQKLFAASSTDGNIIPSFDFQFSKGS